MHDQPSAQSHYLPTLDGWRAIAILMVLLTHDSLHRFGRFSTVWFQRNGHAGVDIFFALSGILICTRLLHEESLTGTIKLRTFYLRRLFRIQPAAWFYLLVITMLMLTGVLDHAFTGVLTSVVLVRNYLPLTFPARDWYTAHFWSLAVEEHFYLILPGFLLLVRRRRASTLLGLTCLLLLWQITQRQFPALQFGWAPEDHTDVAVTGILLASSLAVLLRRPAVRAWCERWLNPYLTLALGACLMLLHVHGRFLSDLLLLIALPLMLASTMLHPASLPSRVLEWKPLRALGLISYSVYLWQMLFFTRTDMLVPITHAPLLSAIQGSAPLRYAAVLACSIASYYLIEQPMIRAGRSIVTTRRAVGAKAAHGLLPDPLPESMPA